LELNLTAPQHNLASTLILLVAIGSVFGGLLIPGWASYSKNIEQLSSLQERLNQYDQLRQNKDRLQREINTLEANAALDLAAFVPGSAPALAAAELQHYLKNMVNVAGGRVTSTQTLPVDESEAFPRISIRVQIKCDMVALHQVLFQLETGSPAAYIDKLFIQSQRRSSRRHGLQTANTLIMPELDVRFELSSFATGFDS